VRDGHVVTALDTPTGAPGCHDTPRGHFCVERAIDGLRVAPLGELWRPRYFHRGYAVHGSPSIPAHPASHGSARLSNAAMDMIWAEGLPPAQGRVLSLIGTGRPPRPRPRNIAPPAWVGSGRARPSERRRSPTSLRP